MKIATTLSRTLLFVLLFKLPPVWAEPYAPVCPATIDVTQKLADTPAGWVISGKGEGNDKSRLENIGFSDGDPVHEVTLAPDSSKKAHGVDTETWIFPAASKEGYWISCIYSQTKVLLTQRIPDGVKSCSVTYDTRSLDLVLTGVKCR